MSSNNKKFLYRILILSFAMWAINFIAFRILDVFYPWPESIAHEEDLSMRLTISGYLQLVLFFLAAFLVAKRIADLKYWKIALILLGIIVMGYHLSYIYQLIDYYLVRGLSSEPEKTDLKQILELVPSKPSPPRYAPFDDLTNWHLFHNFRGRISFWGVIYFLFYGSVSRVAWISALVYFYFKKRKEKVQ